MEKYKTVGLKPSHKVPTVNMKTIPLSELFTNSQFPFYCLLFYVLRNSNTYLN